MKLQYILIIPLCLFISILSGCPTNAQQDVLFHGSGYALPFNNKPLTTITVSEKKNPLIPIGSTTTDVQGNYSILVKTTDIEDLINPIEKHVLDKIIQTHSLKTQD